MKTHQKQLTTLISSICSNGRVLAAEIGVHCGETSEVLLRSFRQLSLTMIDAWTSYGNVAYSATGDRCASMTNEEHARNKAAALARTEFATERRTVLHCSSLEAAVLIKDHSLDVVFIDAAHDYASVFQDIVAWRPKVRPGGLLSGHDFAHPRDRRGIFGVRRAVEEIFNTNYEVGDGTVWWHRCPAQ